MAALLRASVARLNPLRFYSAASRAAPWSVAFATCAAKGAASDSIAQLQVEKKERLDIRRNRSFAFFSGADLGIGQHLIYNVAFTRAVGHGRDGVTALKKVLADATVHVPLICSASGIQTGAAAPMQARVALPEWIGSHS